MNLSSADYIMIAVVFYLMTILGAFILTILLDYFFPSSSSTYKEDHYDYPDQ